MNVHLIRENENQNDGSYIHLYRNKQIGAWCAYGYSAYGLRLFDKQHYQNFYEFPKFRIKLLILILLHFNIVRIIY